MTHYIIDCLSSDASKLAAFAESHESFTASSAPVVYTENNAFSFIRVVSKLSEKALEELLLSAKCDNVGIINIIA